MPILKKCVKILFTVLLLVQPIVSFGQPGDICTSALNVTLYDPLTNPCLFVQLSGSGYNLGSFSSNTMSGTNPGCGYGASNNDFWIRTQVPTNADGVKIAISNPTGSSNDLSNFAVALYTGTSCSTLNYVTCKAGSTSAYFQYFDGMSPLQNVWLRFYKKNTTTGTFGDDFRIFLVATNTSGSNDACAKASPAVYGTYCNYTATNKGEPGGKTPLGLTGNSTICSGGSFNSYDNNQWYYINVDTSTVQPVTLNLRGVSCIGGSPRLQIGLWKAETNNCSLWGSGYNFTNATTAGDGFLLACSVGTGTVTITKSLPTGNYWFTADGGSGSFCTYTLTASPGVLSVSFLNIYLEQNSPQPQINWTYSGAKEVQNFIIQYSLDGHTFHPLDKITNSQIGIGNYNYIPTIPKGMDVNYFRVVAMDKHGGTEVSPVLTTKSRTNRSIIVNYISENRQWSIENPSGTTSIDWQVFSSDGDMKESKTLNLPQGITYLPCQLRSGVYIYQLSTDKETKIGKLVIH